ncbi:MAG: DNA alkylation repair protein [Muribaculaceae bacterium]|nr:DNA alkylation repair protein [Muribaculaceae bacterium]
MKNLESVRIIGELESLGTEAKRETLPRFFKTGKGEYGEGDKFLGVVVPLTRQVARGHLEASWETLYELLASPWHEARLCALLIIVLRWKRSDEEERRKAFDFYLAHSERINNWDLVDLSAPTIVGQYLLDKPRDVLYRLAESPLLWDNRIAMVATLGLMRGGELDDTYQLSTKLLGHPHDLMHKAVGWMLREAGKRDEARLLSYVRSHVKEMPRTTLRYAIERLPQPLRKELMAL